MPVVLAKKAAVYYAAKSYGLYMRLVGDTKFLMRDVYCRFPSSLPTAAGRHQGAEIIRGKLGISESWYKANDAPAH